MALVPVGFGSATFVFSHSQVPRPAVVTLGLDLRGFTGSYADAANKAHTAWADHLCGFMSSASTLQHVDLYIGNGDEPSGSVRSNLPTASGDNGAPMPPANTALLVRKTTTELGRQGKGRWFIPYVVSEVAVNEAGIITPADLDGYNTRLALFRASLMADTESEGILPPVVLHSPSTSQVFVPPPYDVIGFTAQNKVGTQRKRIRG